MTRHYTPFDGFLMQADTALRTVFGAPKVTERANPAETVEACELDDKDKKLVTGLMRINHAGEVCAQALYQGQALTARDPEIRAKLERAAQEENDHLAWCESRLKELGARTSIFDPLWYAGSLGLGIAAGLAGDKWSLGFLAETENQVTKHLNGHLEQLPEADKKSAAIIKQMAIDEEGHEQLAIREGGADLPEPIKKMMKATSKIMTNTVYHI
jgi:ubiquinone biosynthesis monooxygenase Coq7